MGRDSTVILNHFFTMMRLIIIITSVLSKVFASNLSMASNLDLEKILNNIDVIYVRL